MSAGRSRREDVGVALGETREGRASILAPSHAIPCTKGYVAPVADRAMRRHTVAGWILNSRAASAAVFSPF